MSNSTSSSTIMTVAEMIDSAFGEPDVNTVNHKLIQTILYLLARQLRILERRVEVEIGITLQPSSSSLSVTEVKVHAMQKKKKRLLKTSGVAGKGAGGAGGVGGARAGQGPGKGGPLGGPQGGQVSTTSGALARKSLPASLSDKTSSDKTASDKTASDKTSSQKTSSDKTASDKTSSDKTSSQKTSSDKTASDKTSSDKTSSQKTSSDKTSSDKTSSQKTSDKTSSDKTSSDKTSSQKTSSDKTSSDKTSSDKTSSQKTSSDKTSSDKTSSDKTSSQKTSSDKTSSDKTSTDKTMSSGKSSSDKTSSDKTSSQKTSSEKTSSDKTSTDITLTKTSSDKTSSEKPSSSDKTSSEPTSSDKTSSEKHSSSDKTSSEPTSSDKTSSEKPSSSDKTSSEPTSSDKTSSEKPSSSDKTSSKLTSSDKTSSEKPSSSDKTSSEPTSSDKTSSEKPSSSDKTSSEPTSSDKTSSEKPSSSDKTSSKLTSSDKTSSGKPSSSDKTSSEPTSSDKTTSKDKTSSSDKQSTEKSTSEKTSTEKSSSSGKTTTDTTSSSRRGPGDYAKLLDAIEEQREEELRVIRQRANSREEREKTPSPMASLDSVEAKYEKLLVVERIPADEAKALAARGRSGTRDKAPRISVVTQQQFEELAITVRQLEQKFGPVGSASFPENIQLMQELRKGASLTDAMAALQLSARLEASEKALEQMLSLITDLASNTPGFDMTGDGTGTDMEVLFGGGGTGAKGKDQLASRKSTIIQKKEVKSKKELSPQQSSSEESMVIPLPQPIALQETETAPAVIVATEEGEKEQPDRITYEELDNAMQELYDDIIKTVTNLTTKSATNADNAFKLASKLEGKLEASLNLGTRMQDLEAFVSEYSEQINILDTSLSSQMTNYQEELTQMQHDLETALETMAEVLANAGGDTTAVAELNNQFSNLQVDIDDTIMRQKELKNAQNALAFDLESLRKQIEILREAKSDRDEVADALRDKAGLGALNGLVSLQQFDAVRGDIEKRIGNAYDKFNSQETIWQKAIDDLLRELNEKADWIQMVSLKEEINRNLEMLRCRLNAMMEIVGEPRAAAIAKKLHRDATCLSCAMPADMELEEHGIVPALPAIRPPAIGAEAQKPKEDGDHGPCYPGHPIPHPRDPRSQVCQRWCGGSHTVITNTANRVPPSMIITPAVRQVSTALGTDGKMYMVDERLEPCRQCIRKTTPQPSITEPHQEQEEDVGSYMTPSDFRDSHLCDLPVPENETPPPPQNDD